MPRISVNLEEKIFRLRVGILKIKTRSWSFPQLLLIIAFLLVMHIIIDAQYNYYVSNKMNFEECEK